MAAHFKTFLDGADDHAKLQDLCKLTYKEQGVWLLNAIWEVDVKGKKGGELAESIWAYVDKASVIDNAKATGNALDEMEAHRFLEAFDEAHTVLQMRSSLRKTGALGQNERPKEVPLTHFFLDKYETDWHKLVNAPQGDNSAQIAEAQDKLQAVQDAFDASSKADAEAAAALSQAKSAEADAIAAEDAAKAKEAEAVQAEAPFKAAQAEVAAALADVKAQEDAYNGKTEQLKKQSEEGGVVTRNKAKVSLDAHLAEDPLPLRKAKITLEAANKRADKARAPFQAATEAATEARAKAEAARAEAEASRKVAEAAKQRAEAAVQAAQDAVAEAEAYLAELMKNPGSGHGALWWIERELHEKKKYMPVSKGGVR